MARASVVIVGGGIAGLAAAWELTGGAHGPNEQTPRVELIEAGDHLGGALVTTEFAGRTIDLGADGFLARRPEGVALVKELGWEDRLEAINVSGSSIWLRGALYELPTGLVLGMPTSASVLKSLKGLSWRAKLAARRDEWFPRRMVVGDDATIGDIVRTKLGSELSYQFIEPMIGGIQAGRIDDLSAKSVFPALLEAARKGGSLMKAIRPKGPVNPGPAAPTTSAGPLFYSLLDGMGSLPIELARQLSERGVVIRTGVSVTALRRTPSGTYPWEVDTSTTTTPADAIVVATPASVAGRLLGDYDSAFTPLRDIPCAGAAMVTFDLSRTEIELPTNGTGVLVPLGTKWSGEGSMLITAITFLDRKWPRLARENDTVLRAHVGRIDDARWTELSDEELTARVTNELKVLLPKFGTVTASRVQRWPQGLPQYYVGHDILIEAAKGAATRLHVALAGMVYDGVGVPASVGSGRRAAREVLDFVKS
jgi:oxygen-dependent protoporphyrinogen oxidase